MSPLFEKGSLKKALGLICLMAVSGAVVAGDDGEQQAGKDQAKQTYDTIQSRFGDKDALAKNLSSPLISGNSFTTLDGSKSFNQQISCPGSSHYLEVFFALGSGGDLSPVRLKQDTNFDGTYDTSYNVPVPVSGVCANGIISCENGTFNQCKSYLWKSAANGRVTLEETTLSSLAGCYCVNNSCGQNLGFVNRNTILDDLGGGIAGALMQHDPRYAVSAVQKQDFIIRLAGQDMAACAAQSDTPQHTYYDKPTSLSRDAFSASSGDPVFNIIENIPTGDDVSLLTNRCRIERQVTLDEALRSDIVQGSSTSHYSEQTCEGDEDCFYFRLGDGADNNIRASGCRLFTRELVLAIDRLDRIEEAVLESAVYEDQIAISVNGTLVFSTGGFDGVHKPGRCQIDDQNSVSINRDFKAHLHQGLNLLRMVVAVEKKGSAELRGRIRYTPGCDLVEDVQDTCAPYAENDQCQLTGETVDGVHTFQNRGRTGLTPISQPRTLYGVKCTKSFSRPWFDRERTYECETDNDSARSFDFTRVSHIYSGSTFDQIADRQVGEDGTVMNLTRGYAFDSEFGISECEQICKTRVTEPDTEVSSTGVVGDLLNNPEAGSFTYHQCAAGVCPAGPGETIVSDCGCLNEFPQALALMQSMRLAGQDLICTTGTKQPL